MATKYKEYINPEVEFEYRKRKKKEKKQAGNGGPVEKDSSKYGVRITKKHGGATHGYGKAYLKGGKVK